MPERLGSLPPLLQESVAHFNDRYGGGYRSVRGKRQAEDLNASTICAKTAWNPYSEL